MPLTQVSHRRGSRLTETCVCQIHRKVVRARLEPYKIIQIVSKSILAGFHGILKPADSKVLSMLYLRSCDALQPQGDWGAGSGSSPCVGLQGILGHLRLREQCPAREWGRVIQGIL